MKYIAVFITTSSRKEAEKVAKGLIDSKACACVNIIPKIRSIFLWQGKRESCEEYLLIAKTESANFKKLESIVKKLHSYDVPEIIGIPISRGSRQYLDWISAAK